MHVLTIEKNLASNICGNCKYEIPAEYLLFQPKEIVVKRTIRNQRTNNNPTLNCINYIVMESKYFIRHFLKYFISWVKYERVTGLMNNEFYWKIIN
ncbi:Uncharacterized protein FWK35_00002433 [Aphis craccivora]|uniref:Uncharacterized protein n=1 Tax=Aphis craccivora TaxID=307492 RepID=A0A6G0ZI54_APHCR|nr:Uncharacterized protein FWK35_00002433 [Aphis craccivora]